MTDLALETKNGVRLCHCCDLAIDIVPIEEGQSANCPRCGSQLYQHQNQTKRINGNLALAITCLILLIPAQYFDFITIRLVGVKIEGTLWQSVVALYQEGYLSLAILTFLCHTLAPILMCSSIFAAHIAIRYRLTRLFKWSMTILNPIKHWVMLDVFLFSLAISCFKLQDYSDIYIGKGLYCLVILQVVTVLLLSRINVRRYWEVWQPEHSVESGQHAVHCYHCHLSQQHAEICTRCGHKLHYRMPNSVQKTWAYLISASICLIPANLLPISILITNGQRLEDTIFSGVSGLIANDMLGIAIIIFTASIIVPVAKILGLGYLLLRIQFKQKGCSRTDVKLYRAIKWIGKWSMTDLFVIAIMLTLVDRGQVLNFTPGLGALAFGAVVVLTMFAAESLDPRLLWRYSEPFVSHDSDNVEK
ncbi:paraquat-inducible protein A [Vibrio hippocampi]|uniref:Intermembrane transport protein YebS n=1 Tax=Vibrio hippocampi TaxID=654686 RepID=A0ABN8DKY5_9VIBR|nr:paraquat-inducible protein A [Vibrio hippocampi]CAH0526011.1 Intermembrane transport protein YebS [Vibrio hippocampi]